MQASAALVLLPAPAPSFALLLVPPCGTLTLSATLAAQPAVDLATISRIKERGLATSQALTTASWLADVYGARVTGTPPTVVPMNLSSPSRPIS